MSLYGRIELIDYELIKKQLSHIFKGTTAFLFCLLEKTVIYKFSTVLLKSSVVSIALFCDR